MDAQEPTTRVTLSWVDGRINHWYKRRRLALDAAGVEQANAHIDAYQRLRLDLFGGSPLSEIDTFFHDRNQ